MHCLVSNNLMHYLISNSLQHSLCVSSPASTSYSVPSQPHAASHLMRTDQHICDMQPRSYLNSISLVCHCPSTPPLISALSAPRSYSNRYCSAHVSERPHTVFIVCCSTQTRHVCHRPSAPPDQCPLSPLQPPELHRLQQVPPAVSYPCSRG